MRFGIGMSIYHTLKRSASSSGHPGERIRQIQARRSKN